MIFDSHAHYDDKAFDGDREALLGSLAENGIGYVLNACSDLASVRRTLELTERYSFLYGALGIHPSDVGGLDEEAFVWLKRQYAHPKVVAVGEIGLDYYWEKEEIVRRRQRDWFYRQLVLAKELKLPVVIHSREAAKDTYEVMQSAGAERLKGVVHCFSYTVETAREYLKWDYYFGIGGVVTFPNAKKLKEAVAYIPLERILLETDCPYLAPAPNRGKRNSSLHLPYVARTIAQLKNITTEEVVETTCENAKRLFGVGREEESNDSVE